MCKGRERKVSLRGLLVSNAALAAWGSLPVTGLVHGGSCWVSGLLHNGSPEWQAMWWSTSPSSAAQVADGEISGCVCTAHNSMLLGHAIDAMVVSIGGQRQLLSMKL